MRAQVVIREKLNLYFFMGSPEPVEKVQKRDAALKRGCLG